MRRGRAVRLGAALAGVIVTVGLLAVVGYRAFKPQEMLIGPSAPYPAAGPIYDERPFSELRAVPLIVEDRLRVYAEKWRVWADGPVGNRYEGTPYWSYRRWPAQAVGVVAVTTPSGPVVVSQWSDGLLVAIDARKGEVAWRTQSVVGKTSFDGRRTGASVVYEPTSLFRAGTTVIALGSGKLQAYSAETGKPRWSRTLPAGCRPVLWTGPSLVVLPDCAAPVLRLIDPNTGSVKASWPVPDPRVAAAPAGCEVGRANCRLVTVGTRTWLLRSDATLTAVPPIAPGALLAGNYVVEVTPSGVVQGRPLLGQGRTWTWYGQGRPIAADAAGVYLLTDDLTMLGLEPTTGVMQVVGCAAMTPGEQWRIARVQPAGDGRYVAIERVSTRSGPEASDQAYYYGPRPVALVELYPPATLPVWPAKFAACRPL